MRKLAWISLSYPKVYIHTPHRHTQGDPHTHTHSYAFWTLRKHFNLIERQWKWPASNWINKQISLKKSFNIQHSNSEKNNFNYSPKTFETSSVILYINLEIYLSMCIHISIFWWSLRTLYISIYVINLKYLDIPFTTLFEHSRVNYFSKK